MDPWSDRLSSRKHQPPLVVTREDVYLEICPRYPTCPKEERRCLQEIRSLGVSVPDNYVLSNGLVITDFCLAYIMRHHFKPKESSKLLGKLNDKD